MFSFLLSGSLWLIKEAFGAPVCEIGTPIHCGDNIRLEHVDTGKNLHSHLFRAPLSGQQEVSGFGENGVGDRGDNWQLLCDSPNSGNYWLRDSSISLMHVDTKKYLSSSSAHKFTQSNCGGQCPIMDQTEVAAAARRDATAKWQADQGVYFPVKSTKNNNNDEDYDDEL
jgi:dolichyl-phosphate-mannose--protein O-mannosyl transferase